MTLTRGVMKKLTLDKEAKYFASLLFALNIPYGGRVLNFI